MLANPSNVLFPSTAYLAVSPEPTVLILSVKFFVDTELDDEPPPPPVTLTVADEPASTFLFPATTPETPSAATTLISSALAYTVLIVPLPVIFTSSALTSIVSTLPVTSTFTELFTTTFSHSASMIAGELTSITASNSFSA